MKALQLRNVDNDAIEIGELYRKARGSIVDSVRYAIEAGRRLNNKKKTFPHGEWLPWLEANADLLGFDTRRTATMLMRAASKWEAGFPFDETNSLQINREIWGHGAPVRGTAGTGENEWFTPSKYIELARTCMGEIDLDPASSDLANKVVGAKTYFTKAIDGLRQEWHGSVWLNPPYAQPAIAEFIHKLCVEWRAGRVTSAIVLTHNYTDTTWFHELAANADAICFTRGRVQFYEGNNTARPTQGQALSYFGDDIEIFNQFFAPVGFVVCPWERRR